MLKRINSLKQKSKNQLSSVKHTSVLRINNSQKKFQNLKQNYSNNQNTRKIQKIFGSKNFKTNVFQSIPKKNPSFMNFHQNAFQKNSSGLQAVFRRISHSNNIGRSSFPYLGILAGSLLVADQIRRNSSYSVEAEGFETLLLRDIRDRPWLRDNAYIQDLLSKTRVNILVFGDTPAILGDARVSISHITENERPISHIIEDAEGFSVQIVTQRNLTKLGKEELEHILKGELTWAKPPEKRGSISQWFHSWVDDSEYAYNNPSKGDTPAVVLVSDEMAITPETKDLINQLSNQNKTAVYHRDSDGLFNWNKININLETEIIKEVLKSDNDRHYENGLTKGIKVGEDIEKKKTKIKLKESFQNGFISGWQATNTTEPLPLEIPTNQKESLKQKEKQREKEKQQQKTSSSFPPFNPSNQQTFYTPEFSSSPSAPPFEPKIQIPNNFICPLSGKLMENPVKTPSGYVFDKKSLTHYLSDHNSDPISGVPLRISDLKEEKALKESITAFKENNKQ